MPPDTSFEAVLSPVPPELFFDRYYERDALPIHRGTPLYYRHILSIARVEQWLASTPIRHPDVMMVQHEVDIPTSDYAGADLRIDPERLFRRFAEGATIVIHNLERHLPELAALCRAGEAAFSMPFQTNIYLSPPNAQGFRTHYDSHDVFVLQAEGSKHWTLYDTKIELPLPGQGFDKDRDLPGPVCQTMTLHSGDFLYCPRGLMHDAHSTDEPSLHITFGLLGKSVSELMLETVAGICTNDVAFRHSLPPGFARPGFDRTALRARFADLLQRLAADSDQIDKALDRMIENFVSSRRPALEGQLQAQLSPIDVALDDRFAAKPDLIWHLHETEEAVLLVGGRRLTLPRFTAPALAFALSSTGFAPRELPGDIDDAARLVLARRLLREGLLTPLSATGASA